MSPSGQGQPGWPVAVPNSQKTRAGRSSSVIPVNGRVPGPGEHQGLPTPKHANITPKWGQQTYLFAGINTDVQLANGRQVGNGFGKLCVGNKEAGNLSCVSEGVN